MVSRSASANKIRIMACALVLLSATSVRSEEGTSPIEQCLAASGVAGQLDMLGASILAAIPWDAFPDQEARDRAGVLIRESSGKGRLIPIVSNSIREDFDGEKMEAVLQFYNAPTGRKIGRAAAAALSSELLREIREGRSILNALSPARRSILERLIAAERVVEFNARVSKMVVRGLVKGYVDHTLEGGNPMTGIEGRLNEVEDRIGQSNKTAAEIALASFAHTFRSMKDDDLKEYAAFSESAAGQWFRATTQRGLELAAFAGAQTLGEVLSATEPRSRDKKPGGQKKTSDKDTQEGKDLMIGYPTKRK